jgi:D-alanyl-D-alanine carboxypeptidase
VKPWHCVALVIAALAGSAASANPLEEQRLKTVVQNVPGDSSIVVERDGQRILSHETLIACMDCQTKPPVWPASFRWASVTKQVTAVLIMQEVAKGKIDLDAPVSRYLPDFASPNAARISVRQLLRHQSGLPNPDDTPVGEGGMATYYLPGYSGNRNPLSGYCAGKPKGEPGQGWSYNNCDYLVAGALLERVTGKSWPKLIKHRISKPLKLSSIRIGGTTRQIAETYSSGGGPVEPDIDLSSFGAAGSLSGRPADLLTFDNALMSGKLLPKTQLSEMWDGQAELGFIALGQWVFEAQLNGCSKSVRVVERRGAIGNVQVRNFILPDQKLAAAAFIESPDFDFGEIWQGKGFSYDLLSAAACPGTKP